MCCATDLSLSVDQQNKKQNNNREGKMSVYRDCPCCVHLVNCKKTENTDFLLDWRRYQKLQSSFIVRVFPDSKSMFPYERLRSRCIQIIREKVCSVVLRVPSFDSQMDVFRLHCHIVQHRVSTVGLVLCAVECVVLDMNPSRNELKLCITVP